jgi:LysR substrate binding domain
VGSIPTGPTANPLLDSRCARFSPEIGRRRLRDVDEATIDRIFGRMGRAGLSDVGLTSPEARQVWGDELVKALLDGRFDVAIGVEVEPVPGLDVTPWRRQRIDLLVVRNHPFASQPHVLVAQLAGTALVIPER